MTIEYINLNKPKDSLLTAIDYTGKIHCQLRMIDTICVCGKVKPIAASFVLRGKTKSCGCTRALNCGATPKFAGHSKRIRSIWQMMKYRCYNEKANCYHNYGGRGIYICDEWLNNYKLFLDWSLKNGYESNLNIDREDNSKGYSPDNCRWVTHKENCNNRDNCVYIENDGETKTLQQWSEELNINRDKLKDMLFKKGLNVNQLINQQY